MTNSPGKEVLYTVGHCKCGHHVIEKILVVLAWLAGIGFIASAWTGYAFWKWESTGYFQAVVVFVLLAFSMKLCKCCYKHWMGGEMCKDGECKEMHDEHGKHMM